MEKKLKMIVNSDDLVYQYNAYEPGQPEFGDRRCIQVTAAPGVTAEQIVKEYHALTKNFEHFTNDPNWAHHYLENRLKAGLTTTRTEDECVAVQLTLGRFIQIFEQYHGGSKLKAAEELVAARDFRDAQKKQ